MGRRRIQINEKLPRGLRVRDGYYSYRNAVDGTEIGLGRDRREAMKHAITTNVAFGVVGRHPPAGTMLSESEITAAALPITSQCGVYFLVHGHSVVYVGKSVNVHYRVGEHIAKKVYKFDRVHIVPCDPKDVDHLESLYIATLRPKYNRDLRIALLAEQNPGTVFGRVVG